MAKSDYIIKCRASGLYLADMALMTISITNWREFAVKLADEQAAAVVERLKEHYGSFDWQAVPFQE